MGRSMSGTARGWLELEKWERKKKDERRCGGYIELSHTMVLGMAHSRM
jgi:hypothetical protein